MMQMHIKLLQEKKQFKKQQKATGNLIGKFYYQLNYQLPSVFFETPVYNGPSVAIRPSVCALVVLFLHTLKRFRALFLHRTDVF